MRKTTNPALLFAAAATLLTAVAPAHAAFTLTAHRGDSGNAPENTLAAIVSAAGSGATQVELDARLTSDGRFVLMHDATVDRTTDGTGAVLDKTLTEIQTLDAGSWFSPAFAGEPVPTLEDAVNTAIANGLDVQVERKAGTPQQYSDALSGFGDRVSVSSFDLTFLAELRSLNASIALGHIGSGPLNQGVIDQGLAAGVDFLSRQFSGLNAERVANAQAAGLRVNAFTINSESAALRALGYGVDGMTSNDPAAIAHLVPEPATLTLLGAGLALTLVRRRGPAAPDPAATH